MTAAEAELERLGIQAEAAGTAYEVANEELRAAQAEADRAAVLLQQAADAVAAAPGADRGLLPGQLHDRVGAERRGGPAGRRRGRPS